MKLSISLLQEVGPPKPGYSGHMVTIGDDYTFIQVRNETDYFIDFDQRRWVFNKEELTDKEGGSFILQCKACEPLRQPKGSKSTPGLSAAEIERLSLLIEEAGEVITAATKVLRHGWDSRNPDDTAHRGNRRELRDEITDLNAAVLLMELKGDFYSHSGGQSVQALRTKLKYLHHQGDVGVS